MPHLIKFRKGWQNEYLAEFILSKFCLIAKPSTIGEDVGTDFFCTLFNVVEEKYVQPKFSFAIQIKSNNKLIDITKNADYYANLEIPFFVGVVNQTDNSLKIYSGEGIQHFFTLYGNPAASNNNKGLIPKNKIFFEVVDSYIDRKSLMVITSTDYFVRMPFVGVINSKSNQYDIDIIVSEISKISSIIQKNISSLKSGSFIFDNYGGSQQIYAGSTSVKTYEDNFNLRLAECFYNLDWKFEQGENINDEFIFFEKVLLELQNVYTVNKSFETAYNIYIPLKKKLEPEIPLATYVKR